MLSTYIKQLHRLQLKAFEHNEIPIAAILVKDNKIIAKAHNLVETKTSVLNHAELLVINKASKLLKSKYLTDCDIYISLEPCSMCLTALLHAQIRSITYLVSDYKQGALGGQIDLLNLLKWKHIPLVHYQKDEISKQILNKFFDQLRNK